MKNTPTSPAEKLSAEYIRQQRLFAAQPATVQRFFEAQAQQVAEALMNGTRQFGFSLPDQVICTLEQANHPTPTAIPPNQRQHAAGNFFNRFDGSEPYKTLRRVLNALEQSPNYAVAVAGGLLRHAIVTRLIRDVLPAGRAVVYAADEKDEAIPCIPVADSAPAAEGDDEQTPYIPYARKFFLPQWIAFDEQNQLIVNSVAEAEAHIKSMQRFTDALFMAVALAPYISADAEYQQKRYGILGQLVNQARALAVFQMGHIIEKINARADKGNLNRGLWLSLPYFDDQDLRLKMFDLEVIPAGRIVFLPAFIIRAVRQEQVKVAQDTRLNPSTRKHLLALLNLLEQAFENAKR